MLSMERTGLREPSAARILLAFMAGDTDGGNTGPRRDSQLWQERPGPSPRWCGRDREASARTRACRSRPVATRLRGLWRLVGPARAGFRACHGTIRRRCPRLPYVSEPHRTAVTADENVVDVFDHGAISSLAGDTGPCRRVPSAASRSSYAAARSRRAWT